MKTKSLLLNLLSGIVGGGIVLAGVLLFASPNDADKSESQMVYNEQKSDDVQVSKVSLGGSNALGSTEF